MFPKVPYPSLAPKLCDKNPPHPQSGKGCEQQAAKDLEVPWAKGQGLFLGHSLIVCLSRKLSLKRSGECHLGWMEEESEVLPRCSRGAPETNASSKVIISRQCYFLSFS